MKRDSELIRTLLLAIEARPAGDRIAGDSLGCDDIDELIVVEHLHLLTEAGFIESAGRKFMDDRHQRLSRLEIFRLTWAGHELLDAIRNETVWAKTKERTAKVGGAVSVNVLAEVAASVTRGLLGLT